jgi:hypothetical protein
MISSTPALHPVQRKDAFNVKTEYHKFRSKVAQTMFLSSALLTFAMRHAAVHAQPERLPAVMGGMSVLQHSFSPIIMVSVQVLHASSLTNTLKIQDCKTVKQLEPIKKQSNVLLEKLNSAISHRIILSIMTSKQNSADI